MINYKGFYIWSTELFPTNETVWRVQTGYEVLAEYKTLQGAKCAVTKKWSK